MGRTDKSVRHLAEMASALMICDESCCIARGKVTFSADLDSFQDLVGNTLAIALGSVSYRELMEIMFDMQRVALQVKQLALPDNIGAREP